MKIIQPVNLVNSKIQNHEYIVSCYGRFEQKTVLLYTPENLLCHHNVIPKENSTDYLRDILNG